MIRVFDARRLEVREVGASPRSSTSQPPAPKGPPRLKVRHQKKPVPTRFSLESRIERTRIAAKIQSSNQGDSAMKKG
jgi:hypothetical protein